MREDRNEFEDYSTVSETISKGSALSTLSYYNTSILQKIDDIEYSDHNIIYDYLDELLSLTSTIELTDLEYLKFEFRPDLLSYYVYGTADYDFVILALNGLLSPKDFTKKKLKLLDSDTMNTMINKIYNAENTYITRNRQNYLSESITTT
jgi:hypothetical protein